MALRGSQNFKRGSRAVQTPKSAGEEAPNANQSFNHLVIKVAPTLTSDGVEEQPCQNQRPWALALEGADLEVATITVSGHVGKQSHAARQTANDQHT